MSWSEKYNESNISHQHYFTHDNDFPREHTDHKILFHSHLRLKGSSNLVDADFMLCIIKRPLDYLLTTEPSVNAENLRTEFSIRKISGLAIQELSLEFPTGEPVATFKYYAWPTVSGCWVLAVLTACSNKGREEVESLFDLLHIERSEGCIPP